MISARAVAAVFVASVFLTGHAAGQEMDNMVFHFSQLELDASRIDRTGVAHWDASGWIGTDFDRVWWSAEGQQSRGAIGEAEFTALYGHYVRRFWDVVVGYRQDLKPSAQGYLAFGVAGLAPYWFEVSALGFISQEGKPSLRLDADTDLFLTQRLVLTLGGEVEWLLADDRPRSLGRGLADVEFGLRTRYEIRRKFAPYFDVTWFRERENAGIADQDTVTQSDLRLALGLRLIY